MIDYISFSFLLLYFGITLIAYSLVPQKYKWSILLAGSFIFYFVSAKGHVFSLIITSFVVWLIGFFVKQCSVLAHDKGRLVTEGEVRKGKYKLVSKSLLAIGVISILLILFVFKYNSFFIESFNDVFHTEIKDLNIIQPLGISFFTLQAISYLIDVYTGRIEAEKNPLRVFLYLSFLLTIVEGPIIRYGQFRPQFNNKKRVGIENISKGFMRVLFGLFKKVVIADRASVLVSAVFDNYNYYSGISVAAGILFYTLQLYCEFSGVMDIVCGLAYMLGIELPENFKRPFFAKSINEFWQRWHITLGTWLRDYIFYNLLFTKRFTSLSKKLKGRVGLYYANMIPTTIALFFVWFANGFWHGVGWKYICYGMYYYILMSIGLALKPIFDMLAKLFFYERRVKSLNRFRVFRTFIIVNIGMLIFRADSLEVAKDMFLSLFRNIDFAVLIPGHNNEFGLGLYDYAIIVIGTLVLFIISLYKERGIDLIDKIYKLPYFSKVAIYLSVLFIIIVFGAYGEEYGVVDMIYANF